DRDEKAASEAAKEIRDAGGKAESYSLDVARREDCVAMAFNTGNAVIFPVASDVMALFHWRSIRRSTNSR
ncbi:MAG TPA: hypothetical protein VIV60_31980, partial [Polyangiaceae bacterium]